MEEVWRLTKRCRSSCTQVSKICRVMDMQITCYKGNKIMIPTKQMTSWTISAYLHVLQKSRARWNLLKKLILFFLFDFYWIWIRQSLSYRKSRFDLCEKSVLQILHKFAFFLGIVVRKIGGLLLCLWLHANNLRQKKDWADLRTMIAQNEWFDHPFIMPVFMW